MNQNPALTSIFLASCGCSSPKNAVYRYCSIAILINTTYTINNQTSRWLFWDIATCVERATCLFYISNSWGSCKKWSEVHVHLDGQSWTLTTRKHSWSFSGWWYTYPSEKWWSSSVGMMTFPTEWKNKSHVPNHQPDFNVSPSIANNTFCWSSQFWSSTFINHSFWSSHILMGKLLLRGSSDLVSG